MPKIVISYRRSSYDAIVGRMRDKLVDRYGDDAVYMDVDSIPFGIDFREHINEALNEVDVVIAVIGAKWLGPIRGRKPRIFDETDPVRVEVETALRRGIPVVPILVDGVKMPTPEELPESIRKLAFHNAAIVDGGRDFHQHMDRVIRSMDIGFKRTLGMRKAAAPSQNRGRATIWAAVVGSALCIGVVAFTLQHFNGRSSQDVTTTRAVDVQANNTPAPDLTPGPKHSAEAISVPNLARRVALVIGNSNYRNIPQLRNPTNDAFDISALFNSLGFSVVTRTDLGKHEFADALRAFQIQAATADVAAVYYSGHAIEISGQNYLIPIDAKIETQADLRIGSVLLEELLSALSETRNLRLILLDACRDDPFASSLRPGGTRSLAGSAQGGPTLPAEPIARSVRQGLVRVDLTLPNTLVGYAAKAGSVAMDGDGRNSPFAGALIKHLGTPGLDIRIALGRVRDEVFKETKGRQEPYFYGSLGGDSFMLAGSK
jgi:hypothetical protein